MAYKKGRYSGFIRPIIYSLDLLIITILAKVCLIMDTHLFLFVGFITFTWIVSAIKSDFYEVYRYTPLIRIFSLLGIQLVLFTLLVFAFFGFFSEIENTPREIIHYILYVFSGITIVKLGVFYLLKKYRTILGGNFRRVVILGVNSKTQQLENFFNSNKPYGYQVIDRFDVQPSGDQSLESCFAFIIDNNIDEIYCSISEFTNEQIREISEFTDNNLKILKSQLSIYRNYPYTIITYHTNRHTT